ncbi:MAG TPA: molybdopterin converting factor subunit 1 [Thermomicrobiales bacterium]|nr:molybdopterin converting factor subunit 1 [Thermomicrobiales bacterium]
MQIRIRYFAQMREELGRGEETREVDDGMTVGALFDAVVSGQSRLVGMKPAMMLMVNQEYVPADHPLSEGDEVAFIPPVSGGSDEPGRRFAVTSDPLDARAVEELIADPAAGAIVTFTGTVRDHARGQSVSALDYEAYAPAAEKMLARIGEEIGERWGIERVAIWHRTGYLTVGEASVVIAVASAHRGEAFAACQYAIERLKQIVPIWKKEHYASGATWVGSEADYQREQSAERAAMSSP